MTFKEKYGDHSSEIYDENLDISREKLNSLEGCYKEIKGNLNCSYNDLKTLEDGPKTVSGNFWCSNNSLTSLKGSPKIVKGSFNCSNNILISLEGAPKTVKGNFICTDNPKLKSLDAILGIEIKGEIIFDIMSDKEFKEEQKLFIKVGKNLSKFKKLKKLLQATKTS